MENDPIPLGSRWRDLEDAKLRTAVVVRIPGPSSPWLCYEGEPESSMWYCCVEDFFIWNRFERLS